MQAIRLANGNLLVPALTNTADAKIDGMVEIGPDHPDYAEWQQVPGGIRDQDVAHEDTPFARFVLRPESNLDPVREGVRAAMGLDVVHDQAARDGVSVRIGSPRGSRRADGPGAGALDVDVVLRAGADTDLALEVIAALGQSLSRSGTEHRVLVGPSQIRDSERLPWG